MQKVSIPVNLAYKVLKNDNLIAVIVGYVNCTWPSSTIGSITNVLADTRDANLNIGMIWLETFL